MIKAKRRTPNEMIEALNSLPDDLRVNEEMFAASLGFMSMMRGQKVLDFALQFRASAPLMKAGGKQIRNALPTILGDKENQVQGFLADVSDEEIKAALDWIISLSDEEILFYLPEPIHQITLGDLVDFDAVKSPVDEHNLLFGDPSELYGEGFDGGNFADSLPDDGDFMPHDPDEDGDNW